MIPLDQFLEAMEAARLAANRRALECGTKIIAWKNGKIVEIDPKETQENLCQK